MGKIKKKGKKGLVAAYLTQKQAMRRLQLNLPNFRRLCILKGIYPVEPPNRKKVGGGNSQPRIFYHTKDIGFLSHEPLIEKFRKIRVYYMKIKRAKEKKDKDKEFRLRMNKPRYTLQHIVKERYPSIQNALQDLSDSLNLVFLFARLPRLTQLSPAMICLSRRLCVEFMNFVIATKAVRKAFICIKGFYIQVEIEGVHIVWVIPHASVTHTPTDVDYHILATCMEFDATLIGSVLSHLYSRKGLTYPPKLSTTIGPDPSSNYYYDNVNHLELLSCLSYPLKRNECDVDEGAPDDVTELQAIDDQVSAAVNKQLELQRVQNLFKGKRFFLMREVPREVICLIVRSCGGECSWDKTLCPGSTFAEDDPRIDYQIVDRPMKEMKVTRYYVQPQWIFDSLNATRLLPPQDYLPNASLPPHLSPFTAGSGLNDLLPTSGVSQRGGLTGVVPGYGDGATLYRPPEADYLAGLVSLADIRGRRVKAQVVGIDENEGQQYAGVDQVMTDNQGDEHTESESDDISAEQQEPNKQEKKKLRDRRLKKPMKGATPQVTPGKAEHPTTKVMQERAEANAERKLREMLLPKKHRNAYHKMVHSVKRKEKEIRKLSEKRQHIDAKKMK